MKKLDYLKESFNNRKYLEVNWWVRTITDFIDSPKSSEDNSLLVLKKEPWGMSVINRNGEREKIEDYSGKGPLFTILDKVDVDPTWMPLIKSAFTTDFGILTANAILLQEVFGEKIPFINGEISIPKIEAIVASKFASNPEYISQNHRQIFNGTLSIQEVQAHLGNEVNLSDPNTIYVYEYLNLAKSIELITTVMELFSIGLTRKTILPPPGIEEKKKELLSDPNLNLNDPIQLANFEAKLLKFDAENLKDDPSYGKFAQGKILKDSRKKLFLSLGAEGGFRKDGGIIGIATSLSDGIPTDPEKYVATVNGSRSGSYSRGFETMSGGVAAKKMLAASNNYVIVPGDCGSTMGLIRYYPEWLVASLRGRTVMVGKTQTLIEENEDVSPYLGKFVRTRSPMYCLKPGEEICAVCAGKSLARYKTGVSIPLTEISHGILTASMKAMHTNSLTVNHFDLDTLFT